MMLDWFVGLIKLIVLSQSETVVLTKDEIETNPNLISSVCMNKLHVVDLTLDKCLMKMHGKKSFQ